MKPAADMTNDELLELTGFPPFEDPPDGMTQARWTELTDEHQRRACDELG